MSERWCAGYVRVSSRSQDAKSQVHAIERASKARGDKIEVLFSERRSGKTLDRPELVKLRARVALGEIGKLYVFRLDRLTRSGIRDTLGLLEELNAHGCQVVSIADGFELGGVAGDVVVAVMAWAAQMERLALGERISAARERVERSGKKWGRPARLSPSEALRLVTEHKKGRTIRELAAAFKCPRSTVAEAVSQKGAYAPVVAKVRKPAPKRT